MSNIVINAKSNTYVFNKSKFIAFVYHVNDINEVQTYLKDIKAKYCDARHVVYAYRINDQLMKCDEDGEPSNTCGKPILSFLVQKDIINVLVIVVRYFGGILLGTGNLKHAYMEPFFACLENNITTYVPVYNYELIFNYGDLGIINNWIQKTNSNILETEYLEQQIIFKISSTVELKDINLPHNISITKI